MRSEGVFCIYSNDGVFDVALRVHVQVYSNGRVTWTPPALYYSSCGVKVNGKNFIHQIVNLFFFVKKSPSTVFP